MTPGEPGPRLRVGRILRVHGVDGAVRLESLTDFAERFRKGARFAAGDRTLTVQSARNGGGSLIVRFDEIPDRGAAQAVVGAYLEVPLAKARALPAGRFYPFQLVGLPVIDAATGQAVGSVVEVLAYSANDVLRVSDGSTERLIPMVRSVVDSIDLKAGHIVVRIPEETQA